MLHRTRRAVLLAAAGTLAAAPLARKPRAQVLHAQILRAQTLRGLDDLSLLDPPRPPPAFGFTDAEGKPLTLADYRGRGVVLNFWATWCSPCVEELPSLDALARAVAGDGIAVLPLSSDRGGAATVSRFYAAHAIRSLPVLLDPNMAAGHAMKLPGVPVTVLVDRDGQERARFEGSADWGTPAAAARIRALVSGAARAQTSAT